MTEKLTLDQTRRIAIQTLKSLQRAGLSVVPSIDPPTQFPVLGELIEQAVSAAADSAGAVAKTAADKGNGGPRQPRQSIRDRVSEAASGPRLAPQFDPSMTPEAYANSPFDRGVRIARLSELADRVAKCTCCAELTACRSQTVFGVGNPEPELCFVGEAPGADEDKLGEPFVGQAGKLLTRIIEACKLTRAEVYILNTIKCRPPGNRNPSEAELENCWPYAVEQLELLQPKFICCLGSVAARSLLQTTESIGRMRGRFFKYASSQVMVTYHPAYLLRNPQAKAQVWEDMKMLLAAMGRTV